MGQGANFCGQGAAPFLNSLAGALLLLAWVAQPAKEKNVQTLTCTDLAAIVLMSVKKDESDFLMGKDSYNFFY